MTTHPCYAADRSQFASIQRSVEESVSPGTRFPDWPFRADRGFVTIYEYDRILGEDFGEILESLVDTYSDELVFILGIDPPWEYYKKSYGFYEALSLPGASVWEDYFSAMMWHPGGDPTGALRFTLNVVAMAGSSRKWALLGQADWEIAVLLTDRAEGPWLNRDIPGWVGFFDLSDIRSPPGWGMPLSDTDLETFWRNIRMRGSGPGA
jgi:hypothetical protein